ncbi:hypothetical protein TRIUR3_34007 [Triticum urartu]|uniref:Wall-associated receptor kinase galacturonan-binding domain-containing protein n=1 Tax=Triticum urartu TaxID=4572 RepID=M8A9C0_TRIUA|nr:hypothetical protein TRIUR3_34007 [Triticum urartu]
MRNPNFFEAACAQAPGCQEAATAEAQLHVVADENNASYASYALPTNFREARWDEDSVGATISIVWTSRPPATDKVRVRNGVVGVAVCIWFRMRPRSAMYHALSCSSLLWSMSSLPIKKAMSVFLFFAAMFVRSRSSLMALFFISDDHRASVFSSRIVRVGGSRAHKNVTHGPHSCGGVDVPYPFGIVEDGGGGDYRTGFHVMCDAGEPVLHTTGGDGKPIKIGNFSIRMAEVRVWLPVAWQCYDSSGNVSGSDYNPLEFNDEGVYRISHARNNLFVLGCETTGYLGSQPDQGSGESRSYAQFTGCLCYCNNSQSAASGACSGVGCCHVEIPPDLLGNWVAFVIYDHRNKVNFSPCDYAFVAEKKHYSFNTTDLKRALRGTTWEMPVVLDWAIRDSPTCKLARKKKEGRSPATVTPCIHHHAVVLLDLPQPLLLPCWIKKEETSPVPNIYMKKFECLICL